MIRKEGKARWVHTCDICRTHTTHPDQFRAIEKQQSHVRSSAHEFNMVGHIMQKAAEPIGEAMRNLGLAWGDLTSTLFRAGEAFQGSYALVPPPNVPHDPNLLRDRRKWGGR